MRTMKQLAPALAVLATLTLGACGTMNDPFQSSSSQPVYADNAYSGSGVVQSIDRVSAASGIGGSGIGVGAIAGAVIGGILGNQVGGGTGQTVATVAGAAGGAYAGHQLEKQHQSTADAYRFTIRMDNGSHQTLTQSSNPDIRVGDRVIIDNGVVRRR
jgi:outer membrane lipoprotein SlyB